MLILENEHDSHTITNAQLYWQNRYKIDVDVMKTVYSLPYKITRQTELQAFQYKTLTKRINCNYWLDKLKIKDSPKCGFCDEEEMIEYYLFSCLTTIFFGKSS